MIGYIFHSGHKCHRRGRRIRTGYQTVSLHIRSEKGNRTHAGASKGTQLLRQSHHGYEVDVQLKRRNKKVAKGIPTSISMGVVLSRIAAKRKVERNVSITKIAQRKGNYMICPMKYPDTFPYIVKIQKFIHELLTQDFSLYPNENKRKRYAI